MLKLSRFLGRDNVYKRTFNLKGAHMKALRVRASDGTTLVITGRVHDFLTRAHVIEGYWPRAQQADKIGKVLRRAQAMGANHFAATVDPVEINSDSTYLHDSGKTNLVFVTVPPRDGDHRKRVVISCSYPQSASK